MIVSRLSSAALLGVRPDEHGTKRAWTTPPSRETVEYHGSYESDNTYASCVQSLDSLVTCSNSKAPGSNCWRR